MVFANMLISLGGRNHLRASLRSHGFFILIAWDPVRALLS